MQGVCQITVGGGKGQLNLRKANGSLTKLIVQGSNSRSSSTQGNKQCTKTCRLKKERAKEQTKIRKEALKSHDNCCNFSIIYQLAQSFF